jgi:hypothetical protein
LAVAPRTETPVPIVGWSPRRADRRGVSGAILASEFGFNKINGLIGTMILGNIHLI